MARSPGLCRHRRSQRVGVGFGGIGARAALLAAAADGAGDFLAEGPINGLLVVNAAGDVRTPKLGEHVLMSTTVARAAARPSSPNASELVRQYPSRYT